MNKKLNALRDLFMLRPGWGTEFDKGRRFAIAAVLGFFSCYIFRYMDYIGTERINGLLDNATEPLPGLLVLIVTLVYLIGFYLAIVAAAAAASLKPSWNALQ